MRTRGNLIIIGLVLTLLVGTVALIATRQPILGLDLRGGSEIVLQAQPDPGVKVTPEIMNQAVAIYNKRLNALGTTEPTIQKDGTDRIDIQLPGEKDPNRVNNLIGSTGTLYFLPLQDALTPGVSRSVVSGAGISEKNSLWELLDPVQGQAEGSGACTRSTTTSGRATRSPRRPRSSSCSSSRSRRCRPAERSRACRRTRSRSPVRRPRPARARATASSRDTPTGTCSTCRRRTSS